MAKKTLGSPAHLATRMSAQRLALSPLGSARIHATSTAPEPSVRRRPPLFSWKVRLMPSPLPCHFLVPSKLLSQATPPVHQRTSVVNNREWLLHMLSAAEHMPRLQSASEHTPCLKNAAEHIPSLNLLPPSCQQRTAAAAPADPSPLSSSSSAVTTVATDSPGVLFITTTVFTIYTYGTAIIIIAILIAIYTPGSIIIIVTIRIPGSIIIFIAICVHPLPSSSPPHVFIPEGFEDKPPHIPPPEGFEDDLPHIQPPAEFKDKQPHVPAPEGFKDKPPHVPTPDGLEEEPSHILLQSGSRMSCLTVLMRQQHPLQTPLCAFHNQSARICKTLNNNPNR
ncbi:hypothetical protein CRENBAI_019087 [Crenichthys baileyi]|uniref:Uncharacterized protein n=1 Tax=Crenichthys baileyi TaxID=28760 RepID=A0AAV9QWQ3_9TELE